MVARTVSEHYEAALRRNLAAELSSDVELCPKCGNGWVLPNTKGGRFGICQKCYMHHLAEAHKLAAAEIEAKREYDKERKKHHRIRKAVKRE